MQSTELFPRERSKTRSRVGSCPKGAPRLGEGGDQLSHLDHKARQNVQEPGRKHPEFRASEGGAGRR